MKRVLKSLFNIFMLVSMISALVLLIHDFLIWGIFPLFTGNFILVTYFGMFTDMFALAVIYLSKYYFERLFK